MSPEIHPEILEYLRKGQMTRLSKCELQHLEALLLLAPVNTLLHGLDKHGLSIHNFNFHNKCHATVYGVRGSSVFYQLKLVWKKSESRTVRTTCPQSGVAYSTEEDPGHSAETRRE
jgi:hypothetical protein